MPLMARHCEELYKYYTIQINLYTNPEKSIYISYFKVRKLRIREANVPKNTELVLGRHGHDWAVKKSVAVMIKRRLLGT